SFSRTGRRASRRRSRECASSDLAGRLRDTSRRTSSRAPTSTSTGAPSLARNQSPYQWRDAELDAAMPEIAVTANGGSLARLPVVLLADGSTLVAPAHAELAEKIGLSTAHAHPLCHLALG